MVMGNAKGSDPSMPYKSSYNHLIDYTIYRFHHGFTPSMMIMTSYPQKSKLLLGMHALYTKLKLTHS